MFAKSVIDSVMFLDMPKSAQCLYFHLAARANDDGFVAQPRSIMQMLGDCDGDMRLLISKKFLILFETGVVVIKNWIIHQYIANNLNNHTISQGAAAAVVEPENKAIELFSSMIGKPSPHQIQEIKAYCNGMTEEVVVRAIQTALDAGVPNWAYTRSILEDKKQRGVCCIEDWDNLQTAANNQSQKAPAGSAGSAPLGDLEKQALKNMLGG